MTSRRLALFDLDHTLLPLDSDYQWADYLARTGRAGDPAEARRQNDDLMDRYNRGELTAEQAAEFMLGLLAAHTPYDLAAWHEDFMEEVIRPSMTPAARDLVQSHLEAGDLCAVVTATNSFVTAPIAAPSACPPRGDRRGIPARALHRPHPGHAQLQGRQGGARERLAGRHGIGACGFLGIVFL